MEVFGIALAAAVIVGLCLSMPLNPADPEVSLAGARNVSVTGNQSSESPPVLSPCNVVDEIVSNDPCKPLCACIAGKIFCADIMCTTNSLPVKNCWKLPLNGKCCPSYLCSTGNSTGDVHYPLPVLVVPPELNLSSIPPSKAELLHKARRPGSQ